MTLSTSYLEHEGNSIDSDHGGCLVSTLGGKVFIW